MATNEKAPLEQASAPQPRAQRRTWPALVSTAVMGLWLYSLASHTTVSRWDRGLASPDFDVSAAQCRQVDPMTPSYANQGLDEMDDFIAGAKFRNETIERMAGAIQIPSESFDDLGPVGEDERWEVMYKVAEYLEKTFPLIHKHLDLQKVNTHGLLYTWQGSDSSLKPHVLMAHQDVVPVAKATVKQWEHPPFSGTFDGKYIWGRGALDCKNNLIAIMEAVELLVAADFKPKRTVVLSFGFDEEISGRSGAGHLAPVILERYGKHGVASIVDEGGGAMQAWGTNFMAPGVAEKGYIDVNVVVRMPGGHSSVPPEHTGIGVMSELVALLEAHPYEPKLDSKNPFMGIMQCGAAHAPDFPKKLKKLLPRPGHHRRSGCQSKRRDELAREAAKAGPIIKYLFTTSQAVDIVGGGVKANALPERTTALVNHRVNIGEQPDQVKAKITKLTQAIATKHNLTLNAFNDAAESPSSITLFTDNHVLSPSPVTPTSVDSLSPYAVLSGTTRALYGEDIVMTPGIMTGNTDTRYYWDVTEHIFRYAPGFSADDDLLTGGVHTVNERVSIGYHVSTVQWFSKFVRNMDEAEL